MYNAAMSSFYISAAHKSSGKTTLSIGISAAIRQKKLTIQAFKKGPDYIDPIWLSQATQNPCYNLDFFTSGQVFIQEQFHQYRQRKDVVLVEGNMGLFDGMALDGSDSNAAMAKLLKLPVILVIDTSGTSRGIAPLLKGYQTFDTDVQFAGVILNKVAGNRHESKLTSVIREYTDFNILGSVPRNKDIQVTERHLGLIPGNEIPDESDRIIDMLAQQARQHINIDELISINNDEDHQALNFPSAINSTEILQGSLKIAVAMDEAFGFYYPGDLHQFKELGVEIIQLNCLKDAKLPDDIDGLFIGGGFPEAKVEELSANTSLLKSLKVSIEKGLPTYAECGGLMYLCQNLTNTSGTFPMCNVIPATVDMHIRPQGRGYIILESTPDHPWYKEKTYTIKAHEFHYSAISGLPDNTRFAYSIKRGTGIDELNDGIILYNMVASYSHLRQTDKCLWVDNFVSFVKSCKRQS